MERSPETVFDELLVLQAQDGDADALSALVRRWQPRLVRHAMRLVERDDLAQDVVQESWLAMARSIHRLDDPACFPRWAFQIVTRKSADLIRERQRQRQAVQRLAAEQSQEERLSSPLVAEAEVDDALQAMQSALRALPGDRRELLTMFYREQLSVAEIAEVLSIPAGTVKSRLHHARQELKEIFERSRP